MKTITRKDAKTAGLNKYYTGRPCKNGHITYRYTMSGTCAECINAHQRDIGATIRDRKMTDLERRATDLARRQETLKLLAKRYFVVRPEKIEVFRKALTARVREKYPDMDEQSLIPSGHFVESVGGMNRYVMWFLPETASKLEMDAVAHELNTGCDEQRITRVSAVRARLGSILDKCDDAVLEDVENYLKMLDSVIGNG